jgi:hypothetical protein
VLSVRGTPGARQIHLAELGVARLAMLRDESAGFYVNTPLDRQYIIIPRSICDSMGNQFLKDLKAIMDSLFPQPGGLSDGHFLQQPWEKRLRQAGTRAP